MTEIGIVGGGVLGLVLGLRLRQQGHEVTVLEGEQSVGGLASADSIGDVRWDRFYHVILGRDRQLLSLIEEIGLGDRMRWGATRTGFYVDGTWYSMSSALDFLRFPPLSLLQKFRLGATILGASRVRDWRALEEVTAIEWLTRWSGRATVEAIWLPLLRSKLGPNAEEASAAFIWAIIVRMYGARQPGIQQHEAMGYVAGGYDTILPALRQHAEQAGVRVRTGFHVSQVRQLNDGTVVVGRHGEILDVGRVILTTPCGTASALCPQLSTDEHARLRRVVYQGVVCPSYLLKRPLKGYYVTNITDRGLPFTGVIETTALVNPAELGGRHLVYLPRYLAQDDPAWGMSDADIAEEGFRGLQRMIPGLNDHDRVAHRVARARDVLAVSTRRYSADLMPPMSTSLKGVSIVNSAQIAHGTLNVDETIALATRAANALAPGLHSNTPAVLHA